MLCTNIASDKASIESLLEREQNLTKIDAWRQKGKYFYIEFSSMQQYNTFMRKWLRGVTQRFPPPTPLLQGQVLDSANRKEHLKNQLTKCYSL